MNSVVTALSRKLIPSFVGSWGSSGSNFPLQAGEYVTLDGVENRFATNSYIMEKKQDLFVTKGR